MWEKAQLATNSSKVTQQHASEHCNLNTTLDLIHANITNGQSLIVLVLCIFCALYIISCYVNIVIISFRCGVVEVFSLLGFWTASVG